MIIKYILMLVWVANCLPAEQIRTFGAKQGSSALFHSIRLLTRPEAYDGKRVFVDGFVVSSELRCYFFATEEDASRARASGGFGVNFSAQINLPLAAAKLLDRKWIAVEGIFRAPAEQLENGMGGGNIEEIGYIVILGDMKGQPH